jgi:integrase
MATIRRHRDKWQVRVRRDGVALTKTFTLKQDAEQWARHTEVKAERRELPPSVKLLAKLSLADLVIRYRDDITPRKKGAALEAVILNAFLRHPICRKRLSDLTVADFARYRDERLRDIKPNSLKRVLTPVQNMFNVAKREWGIPMASNPVSALAFKAGNDQRERRIDDDEWVALLRAVETSRNPFIGPLVRLARETGMRRSELLRIEWKHVDVARREIWVPTSKNGKPRTIVLTPTATDLLVNQRQDGLLFPTTGEAVKLAWQRLKRRAGLHNQDLRFHDLRHEAISRYFEMDLSLPEVASQSGHSDARMLLRYGHAQRAKIRDKLERSAGFTM